MKLAVALLSFNRTEPLQQLVLFPELIGAASLPLGTGSPTSLLEPDLNNRQLDMTAILASGQLPLFSSESR